MSYGDAVKVCPTCHGRTGVLREISDMQGEWSSGKWRFTNMPRYTFVVAWLENAGRSISEREVSEVSKDAIK